MGTGLLTATGLSIKLQSDLIADLTQDFQNNFGPNVNLAADSEYGKLMSIMSDALNNLWQGAGAIYNSQYPASASGVSLDLLLEITGITRNPATQSTVTLFVTGTNCTISAGSLVAAPSTEVQFVTLAPVTIPVSPLSLTGMTGGGNTVTQTGGIATALYTSHGFAVGQFVVIAGADQAGYNGIQTILTVPDANHFTFAVPPGTVSPATATVSGNMTGIQAFAVAAASVLYGPILANANTITQIVTAVSGWSTVGNQSAATLGANQETDSALRLRRLAALSGLGNATINALEGALLSVSGVATATVYENATDVVDGVGRPPHSIECVVTGSFVVQTLINAIGSKKAAGINTYGTSSGTYVDNEGISHTINYTVPTLVPIYVSLTYVVGPNPPANIDSLILNAILSYGASLGPGQTVNYLYLEAAIGSVPGIDHIVTLFIGTAPSPVGTSNIVIGVEQASQFLSANIVISP